MHDRRLVDVVRGGVHLIEHQHILTFDEGAWNAAVNQAEYMQEKALTYGEASPPFIPQTETLFPLKLTMVA